RHPTRRTLYGSAPTDASPHLEPDPPLPQRPCMPRTTLLASTSPPVASRAMHRRRASLVTSKSTSRYSARSCGFTAHVAAYKLRQVRLLISLAKAPDGYRRRGALSISP